jgi:hypothetical protein
MAHTARELVLCETRHPDGPPAPPWQQHRHKRRNMKRMVAAAALAVATALLLAPSAVQAAPGDTTVERQPISTTRFTGEPTDGVSVQATLGLLAIPIRAAADEPITTLATNVYIKIRHSGKCLTVHGNSTADGAQIDQYSCVGQANQRWNIFKNGPATWFIQNVHSGKCADVKGGNGGRRTPIIQWHCHGGLNQNFQISAVSGSYREISSVLGVNNCLDIRGASTANNTALILWTCTRDRNQQFTW